MGHYYSILEDVAIIVNNEAAAADDDDVPAAVVAAQNQVCWTLILRFWNYCVTDPVQLVLFDS